MSNVSGAFEIILHPESYQALRELDKRLRKAMRRRRMKRKKRRGWA